MSAFHIEDMYDLANEIEMKRQAAVEQAESLSAQWEIVMARIGRLYAQEEAEAASEPEYDEPEYDERMMPLDMYDAEELIDMGLA